MASRYALLGIGALAVFCCAFCIARLLAGGLARRASLYGRGGLWPWILRNGVPALNAVADALLRVPRIRSLLMRAVDVLVAQGRATSPRALASLLLAGSAAVFVAALPICRSVAGAAAVVACGIALGVLRVSALASRREEDMRDAVPDAMRSLLACFQAGLSLPQALEYVAGESRGSAGLAFSRSAHVLQTGGTVPEALACFKGESRASSELAFVGVALAVQHETGGSMGRILGVACDMAESEVELARSLRVQTAQARLSSHVVSAMPFVLIALFSLVGDGFLSPFFESAAGLAVLGLALAMQALGVIAVRRLLRAEGG